MPPVVDPEGTELAVIRELIDLRGLEVVEVGCGEGRLTRACANEGAQVFAFDPDDEAIAAAREKIPRELRKRIELEVADGAEIELPRRKFGLALFSWSL